MPAPHHSIFTGRMLFLTPDKALKATTLQLTVTEITKLITQIMFVIFAKFCNNVNKLLKNVVLQFNSRFSDSVVQCGAVV